MISRLTYRAGCAILPFGMNVGTTENIGTPHGILGRVCPLHSFHVWGSLFLKGPRYD